MKYLVGAALLVISAGWQATAQAEVSEDLKFCGALKSSKERLACYDAAIRIEKAAPVTVSEPAVAKVPLTPKQSRFGGAYVGVTGGYEFANSNPFVSFASPGSAFFGGTPIAPIDSLKGAKVGGLFGYNAVAGDLLFGVEGRAQYSLSKSNQATAFNFPDPGFPRTLQTCFPGCGNPDLSGLGPISLGVLYEQSVARSHQWQIDFSARTGMIFYDWLIFAKTGVGAEDSLLRSAFRTSQGLCDPTLIVQKLTPNSESVVATGCKSITNMVTATDNTERTITPVAILGGGIERNFGVFFLRAEGEFTAHFIKGGGVYYSPSANVAGGWRF